MQRNRVGCVARSRSASSPGRNAAIAEAVPVQACSGGRGEGAISVRVNPLCARRLKICGSTVCVRPSGCPSTRISLEYLVLLCYKT